jgi:hypothetical protein
VFGNKHSILPLYFHFFLKTINFKTFQLFFTFDIILIIFYYYLNKRIHYNTKFIHIFIQILTILYYINHFLLLLKTKKKKFNSTTFTKETLSASKFSLNGWKSKISQWLEKQDFDHLRDKIHSGGILQNAFCTGQRKHSF